MIKIRRLFQQRQELDNYMSRNRSQCTLKYRSGMSFIALSVRSSGEGVMGEERNLCGDICDETL